MTVDCRVGRGAVGTGPITDTDSLQLESAPGRGELWMLFTLSIAGYPTAPTGTLCDITHLLCLFFSGVIGLSQAVALSWSLL